MFVRAKASNAAFLDSLGEVTVGGVTIDTTDEGFELGVSSGTTLKVAPDTAKPAIALAGMGTLDLSGTALDFTSMPDRAFALGKAADGAGCTFAGAPASLTLEGVPLGGWQVKMSRDCKKIVVARKNLQIVIR